MIIRIRYSSGSQQPARYSHLTAKIGIAPELVRLMEYPPSPIP